MGYIEYGISILQHLGKVRANREWSDKIALR